MDDDKLDKIGLPKETQRFLILCFATSGLAAHWPGEHSSKKLARVAQCITDEIMAAEEKRRADRANPLGGLEVPQDQ